MEKKYELSMEEMDKVTGGGGNDGPVQLFHQNDTVVHKAHQEYGTGTIINCTFVDGVWEYDVHFSNADVMIVSEGDLTSA